MLLLAIHSSSLSLGVAVVDKGERLIETVLPPGKRHQENIADLIKKSFKEIERSIDSIDVIAVTKGPGSFSGIRVGMAMAKGLAMGLSASLIGVSSLDCFAWQGLETGQTGVSIIDAKRGDLYTCVYKKTDIDLVRLSEPYLLGRTEMPDLIEFNPEISAIVGDVQLEEMSKAGRSRPRISGSILTPSPLACAQLARIKLLEVRQNEIHTLTPLYIRKSDAEVKAG